MANMGIGLYVHYNIKIFLKFGKICSIIYSTYSKECVHMDLKKVTDFTTLSMKPNPDVYNPIANHKMLAPSANAPQ